MDPVGIPLPEDLLDELDEMKRDWDRREARTVSRSEVAREALALGLVGLKEIDDHNRHFSTQERRAILKQALIDHFDDGE